MSTQEKMPFDDEDDLQGHLKEREHDYSRRPRLSSSHDAQDVGNACDEKESNEYDRDEASLRILSADPSGQITNDERDEAHCVAYLATLSPAYYQEQLNSPQYKQKEKHADDDADESRFLNSCNGVQSQNALFLPQPSIAWVEESTRPYNDLEDTLRRGHSGNGGIKNGDEAEDEEDYQQCIRALMCAITVRFFERVIGHMRRDDIVIQRVETKHCFECNFFVPKLSLREILELYYEMMGKKPKKKRYAAWWSMPLDFSLFMKDHIVISALHSCAEELKLHPRMHRECFTLFELMACAPIKNRFAQMVAARAQKRSTNPHLSFFLRHVSRDKRGNIFVVAAGSLSRNEHGNIVTGLKAQNRYATSRSLSVSHKTMRAAMDANTTSTEILSTDRTNRMEWKSKALPI